MREFEAGSHEIVKILRYSIQIDVSSLIVNQVDAEKCMRGTSKTETPAVIRKSENPEAL